MTWIIIACLILLPSIANAEATDIAAIEGAPYWMLVVDEDPLFDTVTVKVAKGCTTIEGPSEKHGLFVVLRTEGYENRIYAVGMLEVTIDVEEILLRVDKEDVQTIAISDNVLPELKVLVMTAEEQQLFESKILQSTKVLFAASDESGVRWTWEVDSKDISVAVQALDKRFEAEADR